MKIYGYSRSGNCLKVKYVADKLGKAYAWEEVDVLSGYTHTPAFLAINPMGQIPTVVFSDNKSLAQSNAIMRFLADGSSLLGVSAWENAKIDEWLFWEQYSHEPCIAVVRFLRVFKNTPRSAVPEKLIEKGNAALDLMERHLQNNAFFVANRLTIADIGLLAYTQFAEEADFSLSARQNVTAWIDRVRAELLA